MLEGFFWAGAGVGAGALFFHGLRRSVATLLASRSLAFLLLGALVRVGGIAVLAGVAAQSGALETLAFLAGFMLVKLFVLTRTRHAALQKGG